MKPPKLLSILAICLLVFHCTTQPDTQSLKMELLQSDKDWAGAAKSGDLPKLTTYWADDAINFFPGVPPAIGKEAILELVRKNRSQAGFSLSWEPDKAEVAASGDLGYTYGTFQLSFNNSDSTTVNRTGNYVCVWRKDPGSSWKCIIESTIFSAGL